MYYFKNDYLFYGIVVGKWGIVDVSIDWNFFCLKRRIFVSVNWVYVIVFYFVIICCVDCNFFSYLFNELL